MTPAADLPLSLHVAHVVVLVFLLGLAAICALGMFGNLWLMLLEVLEELGLRRPGSGGRSSRLHARPTAHRPSPHDERNGHDSHRDEAAR